MCDPLAQHPEKAKIDDKKRVVLGFVVQSKAALERAERRKAESRRAAAAVGTAAAATAASMATKRKAEEDAEGDKAHLARTGPRAPRKIVPCAAAATTTKPGYAPSYIKPHVSLADSPVPTTEAASQTAQPKSPESAPARPLEPAESWTGVKALLGKFVRDLNSHLADTFGDEAAPFELREHSASPDVVMVKEEDAKVDKAAVTDEPPKVEDKKVVHYSVYCDCCMVRPTLPSSCPGGLG